MKIRKRIQRPSGMVITSRRVAVDVVAAAAAVIASAVDEEETPAACSSKMGCAYATPPDCTGTLLC
jgi:hypothetical protein